MAIELKIHWSDSGFAARLRELIVAGADLTPTFKIIGEQMMLSIDKNFENEGRPEKWAPLADSTILARLGGGRAFKKDGGLRKAAERKLGAMQILTKTARLRRSMDYRADRGSVRIGTNVIYAAIHQFGGPTGRAHKTTIPARPYILIQDEDARMVENELGKRFTGGAE